MRSLSRLTGLDRIQASKRVPALQVAKTAVAAVGAWLLAGWLIPGPLPVFAAVAALLVVQPSVNQSFAKALERSAGVVIGVAVASAISLVLGPQSWVILLAIVVAMVVAWLLRMTATTSNQVAISAMLVLALGASTPEYALDRILETLIGAAFGLLVNAIILPPVLVGPAQRDTAMLGNEIAASLERLADAIEQPQTAASLTEMLLKARLLRPMAGAAENSIADGLESLAFNPRKSSHHEELVECRQLLDRFRPIVTQLTGMTRAVAEHWEPTLADEPQAIAIAEQLRRAAHDTRILIPSEPGEPRGFILEPPALTAPLVVSAPKGGSWVLIGSLIEDLRRIHEGLTADA
ncbi:FUSC family protein [Pseudoclavibacter sp. VKM Ac-2867]|uniref:FUSC family protein n=1 Tax=Pseudoclavibacter sp. VKM Ac-2867 TaxID=2783829 RepID=UPI00188B2B12|nr:FUSC family protein [Pseudoclavibacter sp. VKM Ac-2867]MBF4457120.1 FUSC family protein [Pseudoclavibacter sp. VKM Ac-2867]